MAEDQNPVDLIDELLESGQILHLQPDDTLVLIFQQSLSDRALDHVASRTEEAFGRKVVVLEGAEVGVIRSQEGRDE